VECRVADVGRDAQAGGALLKEGIEDRRGGTELVSMAGCAGSAEWVIGAAASSLSSHAMIWVGGMRVDNKLLGQGH